MNLEKFDIIIVGGGIMGLSTLYHISKLNRTRNLKIALVERTRLASGSTHMSGGFVRAFHWNNDEIKWSVKTLNFLRKHSQETNFNKIGCYYLADGIDLDRINISISNLKKYGEEVSLLDSTHVNTVLPQLRNNIRDYIIYEKNAGFADPLKTSLFYAELAKTLGASIFECAEVDYIKENNNNFTLYIKNGGILQSKFIHLSLGAWSQSFCNKIGLTSESRAKRIQADSFLINKNEFPSCCLLDYKTDIFTRPIGINQQLLGTATEDFNIELNKELFLEEPQREICMKKIKTILDLKTLPTPVGGRVGFDGYSSNLRGRIYLSSEINNISISEGWSGAGFKMAHGVGYDSAKFILDRLGV